MKLVLSGFCYRTSGSAEPFEQHQISYEDLGSIVGKSIDLPWADCRMNVKEVGEGFVLLALSLRDQSEDFDLRLGDAGKFRGTNNVLGVEIDLALTE